jgi:hypothetical protein
VTTNRGLARRALKDWLLAGNIPHLDDVFIAHPLRLDFSRYSASEQYQCLMVIVFAEEGELRFALGGEHSGMKRIDYLVSLEIYFRSLFPDPDLAIEAFDELIDATKARLRADRRLAQDEDIVWQCGEGGYGIQCDFMIPDNNQIGGEPIEHYGLMRFEITQWIVA